MSRIYFAVFGGGLGHATRILDLADQIKHEGDAFLYSSFDEGLNYLRAHGRNAIKSPSVDLRWNEVGGFSSRASFVRSPLAFLSFCRQVGFEAENIRKFNPTVVVSDSRLSAVFASKIRSRPLITILNQFKVLFPPRFRGKRLSNFYERIEGDVLGLFWSLSKEVLMPDLPPPYTISEANVAGTDVSNTVKYVGFMSPQLTFTPEELQKTKQELELDNRPLVFIQISGPDLTKNRFKSVALRACTELSRRYKVIISLGYPRGSGEPRKLSNGALIYEWCPIIDKLMVLADALVSRSGHRTIGQCINAGKPAVLIPIYNHSEQIANAEKFQELGLGSIIRAEHLNERTLSGAIEACLNERKFGENAEKLRAVSMRYPGLVKAAQIVNSYL